MTERHPNPWLGMTVASLAVVIVSLDMTVLNVSIPTILRTFDTTLPTLQWVITGYALTYASLLIVGGRLGDLFGHRRVFVIGAVLFAVGSAIAARSGSVTELLIGEAVIEGIGASLMMPATLAILSTTFEGKDRVRAFGLWGAVGGASAALGPVVGGYFTSNLSWRWCFGINVVVAPLAAIGALVFIPAGERRTTRERLDLSGAILAAAGVFFLVLGISEAATTGWFRPIGEFHIGSHTPWPASAPVSFSVVCFVISAVILGVFVAAQRAKGRRNASPLFDLTLFRHKTFRIGVTTVLVMSIGQMAMSFTLPIFLQEGRQLSAQTNGFWQLPVGLSMLVGTQIASRLTIRFGPVPVVRTGFVLSALGFAYIAVRISGEMTFLELFPGQVVYGVGMACAMIPLTYIVLSEVELHRSGAASGANNTAKQLGVSVGVAIIGSLLTGRTVSIAAARVGRAEGVSDQVRQAAVAAVRAGGVGFRTPSVATPAEAGILRRVFVDSIADAARVPLVFSVVMLLGGLAMSSLLPRLGQPSGGQPAPAPSPTDLAQAELSDAEFAV